MSSDLATTNVLLGIMAAVSVLEALLLIGVSAGAFMIYRKLLALVDGVEARQVAPMMARVNAILDDVKGVTRQVKEETERVDQAIRATMVRVEDAADRVRSNVWARTSRIVGLLRGLRVALETMWRTERTT